MNFDQNGAECHTVFDEDRTYKHLEIDTKPKISIYLDEESLKTDLKLLK